MPRSSFDRDGTISSTSLSTVSTSPGRVGLGHLITEERGPGSFLIKMKHLRIELGRKGLDLLFIESMRSAHKSLTHLQILQVKAASRTRIASGSHRISVHSISPMSRQRAI